MTKYSKFVKDKLTSIIKEMEESPESFVKNPGKDFTRNRKLTFEYVINLLLSMGGNNIYKELLEYFKYDVATATSSAFVQQRGKILPSALEYLFKAFTNSFDNYKTFNGYRLLAADGSKLNIAHNPEDTDTYIKCQDNAKGFNVIHLNALFDLCNKVYTDACIQPVRKLNENGALTDMVDKSSLFGDVIVIADRGYESYNTFAHIQEKGWKYVIRVRDRDSKGMASSLKLPSCEVFDKKIDLKLTRRQTKEIKANSEIYKFMPKCSKFDYLELKSPNFYPISFRVVRFKISDNTYETIITNLDSNEFSADKIKELYHMRWGIETSFRELKYALGLINFHSKKVNHIAQEVFAKLTMYNFCEIITLNVVILHKQRKHEYQVNFTVAIHICRYFFRYSDDANPPDVELLIQQNILPIRKGRKDQRKLRAQSSVSFIYRVA
ncbi:MULTISPECIES: IS4 family transposase [unclassified Clostridium]|uniref:IS4 family transposase n=1 Tax=unclassified Clostridium TaxID=2614128 RepID=UPI0013F913A5|nr:MULTISPECIES: IS4 family transposase [unclassified Clostridium]MBN1051303.1 IS4 family transposase [Clostridium botulinum]NFR86598.1 IS4 family transposase [Clostridium botulinum]NFR91033.1 IS4 family transposase [Clostridium botulinum]NFT99328.1 IS4 family transposase [Clostridium botulinum]